MMIRLFPMQTKGKVFRAAKTHLNPKSTKKRIEILSVSNAWGVAILLHNVQTSGQWWLESMGRLKQQVRRVTMMMRYHNWKMAAMIALKALWEVSSWWLGAH